MSASTPPSSTRPFSLREALSDGFYLLLLLKAQQAPMDAAVFRTQVLQLLDAFEQQATQAQASPQDIRACSFAYCATLDELILGSSFKAKESWQSLPLQVQRFGEQLAGEHFFDELDALRQQGASRQGAMAVFQLCLLLGFQGKYRLDGADKLHQLTARLDDELARFKHHSGELAPHWAAPDRIRHPLQSVLPTWVMGLLMTLSALLCFAGLRWHLDGWTRVTLAPHGHIVQLAPPPAHVTVSWP